MIPSFLWSKKSHLALGLGFGYGLSMPLEHDGIDAYLAVDHLPKNMVKAYDDMLGELFQF